MNMNMKNEKTMLALVLVAALAMVSVAGVALASESDAAATYSVGETYFVAVDTTNVSLDFYGTSDNATTVIIPIDFVYNGTISYGTYDAATNSFTAIYSITLKNATGVTVSFAGTTYAPFTVTPNDVKGTVESVTVSEKSTVTFGAYGAYAVSTSVECANAAISIANVSGITIEYNNGAIISGTVVKADGNKPTNWNTTDDYYASVSVSGTAYYTNLSIGADVELVIAENAVLSSYTSGDMGIVDVQFSINKSTAVSASAYVIAVDNQNNVIYGTMANVTVSGTTSTTVSFHGLDVTKTYTIYLYDVAESGAKYLCGTLTLGTTLGYAASTVTMLTTNATAVDGKLANGTSGTVPYISYDATNDTFVKAFAVDSMGNVVTGVLPGGDVTGKINFTGLKAGTYNCVVLLTKGTTNYVFIGTMVVGNNNATTLTATTATAAFDVTSNSIEYNDISFGLVAGNAPSGKEYPVNAAKMTINGTFNISEKYGNVSTTFGSFSTVNLGENGSIVASQSVTIDNPTSANSYKSWDGLNAAYYTVTVNSVTTQYYTTLAAAMKNASQITVLGYLVITDDLELTGNATVGKNKFTFTGTLVVGNTDKAATVTLPSTSTASYNNSTSILVINGKYVTIGIKTDASSYIRADAFISSGNDGIYTDLATALDSAVSGDKILLRKDATLSRAATVIDGVTLDVTLNGYKVTVKAGASLTVIGTAKFATIDVEGRNTTYTPAKAAGIITINSNNVTFTTLNVLGVVNIGASDLKLTSGTININSTESKYPVIFNITGTVNNDGVKVNSTASDIATDNVHAYVTWNVSGTFTNKVDAVSGGNAGKIVTTMNVTGSYIANSDLETMDLTITGNGSVTVAENTTYTITVSGKLVIGTETKDIAANTNNATAVVTLSGDNAVAYIYGNFDDEKIIVTANMSAAFIIKGNTYCTIYSMVAMYDGDNAKYKPVFSNYTLVAWYSDESLDTIVSKTPTTTDGAKYYADVIGKSFAVTLTYVQNGNWIVNDHTESSGTFYFTYGEDNTIIFTAADGYTWTGKILVNDKEMPAGYTPKEGDVFTVSAEPVEKETPAEGMDLVTILLIIITIVIIIMAIIIALKLMRS